MNVSILAALASTLAAVVCGAPATAQTSTPVDFSGRWMLTVSAIARPAGPDTLDVTAPDELLITQTPLGITVEHPSKPGTHPAAGTFTFAEGGNVGGVPAEGPKRVDTKTRWGVSFVGAHLIISRSTTSRPAYGPPATDSIAAIWNIVAGEHLVIEFEERRTGENPKSATRIYVRPSR